MIETLALGLFLASLPFWLLGLAGVTILKITGGLALAAWLLSRLHSTNPIRWDPGLTLMVLFVVWGTASGLWSIDPANSMAQLSTYVLLLVSYFLIINVIRNERQLSTALIGLWLGTLVIVASGALELAAIGFGSRARLQGIVGNANVYVTQLVACVPAYYWVVTRTRVPFRRVVTAAAFVVAAITSLYTQSRGGTIAIAAFCLSLLAFRQTRRHSLVFALLFLGLAVRVAPLPLWERWEDVKVKGGNVRNLELWPAGMKAFASRPWLGSGLGTNAGATSAFLPPRRAGIVVHSAPLAVAIELGFPGLALYLGFLTYITVRLLRALTARMRQGRAKEVGFAAILLASFVGYMTTWFKGGGAEYSKMLWVLLGLMSAYARILEQPPSVAGAKPRYSGRDGTRFRQ